MIKKIFKKFKTITHLNLVSYILAIFAFPLLFCTLFFSALFRKRMIVKIAPAEARERLLNFSPKPDGRYAIINKPINNSLDLSIIVPCYNVENYVRECIDSLINQKTKYKYEIIIINDGSTDNTLQIISEYRDNRIKILNQENKGLSEARNTGINNAVGANIMFVDSDDFVSLDIVESMLDAHYANASEITMCELQSFLDGKMVVVTNTGKPKRISEMKNSEKISDFPGFACAKVFKRALFNDLRFPANYIFEDTIIQFLLFRVINKFYSTGKAQYFYRIRKNSITQSASFRPKVIDTYWIIEEMLYEDVRLNINNPESLYRVLLIQSGTVLYSRLRKAPQEILEAVFALLCKLQTEYYQSIRLSQKLRAIEKALIRKDINLWKLYCKYC